MIGNDLIDLLLPDNQGKAEQKRLLKKICTPDEQIFIQQHPSPHVALWWVWSCKESAYKITIKCGCSPAYRPTELQVIPNNSEQTSLIHTPLGCFYSRSIITNRYIHTVATQQKEMLSQSRYQMWHLEQMYDEFPIANITQLYLSFISQQIQQPITSLQLRKEQHNVPRLYQKQQTLPYDISISNDGQGIAIALLMP